MYKQTLKAIMTLFLAGSATIGSAANDTMPLHSGWKFRQANRNEWHPATVPGVVHTDLMDNGLIEDPYYRLNERSLQWIDKEDWIYEVSFDAGALMRGYEHIRLEFLGLDTYADVFLNETQILTADNMFRRWAAEVKPLLKERGNVLRVYFHSPINKALPLYESLPYRYEAWNDQADNGGLDGKKLSPFTRKAGYHYGWDWGPRLVTSGIWRPVKLQGWNELRLEDVFHRQTEVSSEAARVETQVEIEAAAPVENAVVTVSDGKRVLGSRSVQLHAGMNRVSVPFTIEHPKLWWCRGMGEPHLYTFRTSVELGGRVLAGHSAQVGFRSVTVEKKPDAYGRSLRFLLNGEPVFCKGANYIPCDCFLPRVTRETYERTIRDAVDVNMNMLRVWGGGIYEDDFFYELCDREGILIWQDFMYACAVYPAEGALLENMRLEAVDNVKRLRNHACVVYWCGNNENQDSWLSGWKYDVDKVDPKYSDIIWKQYEEQYYRMLAQVVAEYAPDMGYQPTSPFSDYGAMSNDHEGDRHYWEVWHAKKPITEYNRQRSRFFSEYGFQSFPCFETVKRYAPLPGDQDITSEVMMSHQRGGEHANNLIKSYLLNEYHEPHDFESFLYASQILQGDAIKTAIEAHRRDKGYCWGSLYWQHNDCWPVASWASRDYYGRWKAQHYFARQAYRDLLVSPIADEEGMLNIYVVSDRPASCSGTLDVKVIKLTGEIISDFRQTVKIAANTSRKLFSIELDKALKNIPKEDVFIYARLTDKNKNIYSNQYFLVKQKEVNYPKVSITRDIKPVEGGFEVTLKSDYFARAVFLSTGDAESSFSDNYFDILPGTPVSVVIYTVLSQSMLEKQLKVRVRTLPIIKNKESALRMEVKRCKTEAADLEDRLEQQIQAYEAMFALWNEFDASLIKVNDVHLGVKKIAGVRVPLLENVDFEIRPYSMFNAPKWYADGIHLLEELAHTAIEREFMLAKLNLLEHARKKTTQKVNLFEKVQIPGYQDALRKIKRFMEDEENLSKSSQKIMKSHQEKRKEEEA